MYAYQGELAKLAFIRTILPTLEIKRAFQEVSFFGELMITFEKALLFILPWIKGQQRYLLIPLDTGMLRASLNLLFVTP